MTRPYNWQAEERAARRLTTRRRVAVALFLLALGGTIQHADSATKPTREPAAVHVARVRLTPEGLPLPAGVPLWPWMRLAQCESGERTAAGAVDFHQPPVWHYHGYFDGGLQDLPGTWSAYAEHVRGAPTFAWQATPAMQVRVNRYVLADQGWRAWPRCSIMLGLR